MNRTIQVFSTVEGLMTASSQFMMQTMRSVLRKADSFSLVLSGGNTPKALFALLAAATFDDWHKVHFFWGDERMVPPGHADSNFGMARENLLGKISVPQSNIHRMHGEIDPAEAAEQYAAVLQEQFGQSPPDFDLVLLGMGDDGHTASLFPGTEAIAESANLVVPVYVPRLHTWRVSLTYPAINQGKKVMFLVAGESKAAMIGKILGEGMTSKAYPASLVKPVAGEVWWLLDAAAARLLGDYEITNPEL